MFLSQLSEVNEIDNRINQIHGELSQLYKQRADLLDSTAKKPAHTTPVPAKLGQLANEWSEAQYAQLENTWRAYDIDLPSYKTLKNYLLKAHKAIQDLTKAKPAWQDAFMVVFVPSSRQLPFPASHLRQAQSFITTPDYVDSSVPAVSVDKKWRMFLVFADDEGLYSGSPEMMLDKKEQTVAGYNIAALGLREYTAFSLQQTHPIDVGTWTVLPKGRASENHIPCVSYIDGQFRFVTDEVNGVFGDNRFRPTVEIKA